MENIPEPQKGLRFIDVHCHVPYPHENKSVPEPETQLKNFKEAGGIAMITSSIDLATLYIMSEFARKHESVYYYVGWAPQTVTYSHPKEYEKERDKWLEFVNSNNDYLGIGEIGLDFHHAKTLEKRIKQIEELRWVFENTISLKKPFIFHLRNPSQNDTDRQNPNHEYNAPDAVNKILVDLLNEYHIDTKRCMLHCFSGPEPWAQIFMDLGFTISVPSSAWGQKRWRKNSAKVKLEYLVTETDSPYQHFKVMEPINEPKNVAYAIAAIAHSHNLSQEAVAEQAIKNAERFFGKKF
jgi:TatD DNase family protein